MAIETPWTPALVTLLAQLWREGLSTAEIGRRLGVSKCAAVGKAHRIGLPNRDNPVDQGKRLVVQAASGGDGCRYPLWPDGAPPDFSYCGRPRIDVVQSYCAAHHKICWVKPRVQAAA